MELKFSIKMPKVKKPKVERGTKLLQGLVVLEEDGTYKVHIKLDNDANLVLPFTKESYSLRGRTNIFNKVKGKYGYERIVRDQWKAKFAPGDERFYIPFCPNWIVNGYIHVINGVKHFSFNKLVTINGLTPPVDEMI